MTSIPRYRIEREANGRFIIVNSRALMERILRLDGELGWSHGR